MSTRETGKLGEHIAARFLEKKGYKILDRNYRFAIFGPQKGEIDIVAKKGDLICFIEVKTLCHGVGQIMSELSNPEIKVDFFKMRKIQKAAMSWLMKNKIPLDSPWQIDVVAVIIDNGGQKAEIRHLQNAVY